MQAALKLKEQQRQAQLELIRQEEAKYMSYLK